MGILKLVALPILVAAFSAMAKDQLIVTATNQEDSEVTKLYLGLDQDNDIKDFKVKGFRGNKEARSSTFKTDDGRSGILLAEMKGREIVKLFSNNFSDHQGGNIEVEYLTNGITGRRERQEFDLMRNGDQWALYFQGRPVSKLKFLSNRKAFVGTIGVKEIQVVK